MAGSGFTFIVSSGPKVPKDPALRTLIRKQAMKDVGIARKKRGSYGQVNLRQKPSDGHTNTHMRSSEEHAEVSADNDSNTTSSSSSTSACPDVDTDASTPNEQQLVFTKQVAELQTHLPWMVPLNGPPGTDFQRLRMKYHFDIRDLSILTSFNVGSGTMIAISKNPESLSTLLGSEMQSYLQYIPNRYGHKPFLTAVIDCVSAKVHSKLYPRNDMLEGVILRMYAKALAYLQVAVAGDESSLDPDLLCAIQMLSLHEVSKTTTAHGTASHIQRANKSNQMFEPDRSEAYLHHINGSALVVKRLTPARFKTDYEKMLFHAHIGPTFTEALMKNERCYLEQPKWMCLYESMIQDDTPWLTDRSGVVIRIRMRTLNLCSTLIDTTEAMDPETYAPDLLFMTELKARQNHTSLTKSLEEYKAHVLQTSMSPVPQFELALRREVYGTALECLCVYKRVLASFCESERLVLESEAQALASQTLELHTLPAPRHSWLYTEHEKSVADVIRLTRTEWEQDLRHVSGGVSRKIACERWTRFNGYLHGAVGPSDSPLWGCLAVRRDFGDGMPGI
jgi:hypothetical protein